MTTTTAQPTVNEVYFQLFRQRPDRRLKESTIQGRIDAEIARRAEAEVIKAAREAERVAAANQKIVRATARGPIAEYGLTARRTEGSYGLARAARFAVATLEEHKAMTTKLATEFLHNPSYALTWGLTYFEHAANYNVAKWIVTMFEDGQSIADIGAEATRQALQSAGSVNRSTSPTSNLMEDYQRAAWVRVAGFFTQG
jgi:hypothetical protein